MSLKEISKYLHEAKSASQSMIHRLKGVGLVEGIRPGVYRITKKGEEKLTEIFPRSFKETPEHIIHTSMANQPVNYPKDPVKISETFVHEKTEGKIEIAETPKVNDFVDWQKEYVKLSLGIVDVLKASMVYSAHEQRVARENI